MRKFRGSLVAFVVGVIVLATPGAALADDESDATTALQRQFQDLSDRNYDRLYGELHPAQQKLLSKARLIECGDSIPDFDIKRVEVEKFQKKPHYKIPGTDVRASAVLVTYDLTIAAQGQEETTSNTRYLAKVGKKWLWLTKPARFTQGCVF
jgi:hypothetical protein